MNPLQIGLGISASAAPGSDPIGDARTAERLGFDLLSASDHPSGPDPTYETWTLLTAIGAATRRIRIAPRVLSVPFRSPALVAKMAESLDRLTGGRLILGLGGGAADEELRGFGLPVPSARAKVDGLEDAVRIVRGLWSEPAFTYEGPVHQVRGARLEPKPAHRVPIWLGTFGPRALAVTGRLADGWIPSLGYASADELREMRRRVRAAAAAAGRDPDELTCALNLGVHVGGRHTGRPGVVAGGAALVVDTLEELVAAGFTTLNVLPVGPRAEQVERLAADVVPALRSLH